MHYEIWLMKSGEPITTAVGPLRYCSKRYTMPASYGPDPETATRFNIFREAVSAARWTARPASSSCAVMKITKKGARKVWPLSPLEQLAAQAE